MKVQLSRLALATAIGVAATTAVAVAADPPKSIRIGYAVSLSGVNAQGAATTTLPGYKLWVDDVNKKGGILVKEFNKRIPIEVTQYDDTSNAETAVRLVERLMTQDKVDLVLPPWSTGFNFATAPVFARNGYPQLAVTANSNDAAAMVKQFPTLFFFLNEPRNFGAALGEVLSKLKSENKINNKIVMLSVADQFGAEFSSGVVPVLQREGFDFVLRKSYPLGVRRPDQRDQGGQGLGRGQLRRLQLSARHLHAHQYRDHAGLQSEGVPHGAWALPSPPMAPISRKRPTACSVSAAGIRTLPGAEDYRASGSDRGCSTRAADGWAAPVTYASLQVLEQAIEKAGTLDRKKVLDTIDNDGPWQTIVGPIDLKTHIRGKQWGVGQWQGGKFVGIAPSDLPGAKPIVFPKPAW